MNMRLRAALAAASLTVMLWPTPAAASGTWSSSVAFTNQVADQVVLGGGYPVPAGATAPAGCSARIVHDGMDIIARSFNWRSRSCRGIRWHGGGTKCWMRKRRSCSASRGGRACTAGNRACMLTLHALQLSS